MFTIKSVRSFSNGTVCICVNHSNWQCTGNLKTKKNVLELCLSCIEMLPLEKDKKILMENITFNTLKLYSYFSGGSLTKG